MEGPGGLVFAVAGLLALIAFLPRLAARLRLPYTVLLAALGCGLGVMLSLSGVLLDALPAPIMRDFLDQLRLFDIKADLLLWVFLPILLFDTATKLDGRELLDDVGPILILAVVAVLMTTAAAGLAVWSVSTFSLSVCFLVAAIIATTDPSAVTAVFREVGARRRLTLLVEGESLLNDAAAIALFTTLLRFVTAAKPLDEFGVATGIVLGLGVAFVGGALVGAILGRVAAIVVSRIDQGGPAEVTLSVALAYLSYALAETYLHVSGVVAVVVAGLVFGTIGRMRVGTKEWQSVSVIWSQLGFWASSLVFVLASMLVPEHDPPGHCQRPPPAGRPARRRPVGPGLVPVRRAADRADAAAAAADQRALQAGHPLGRRARRGHAGVGAGGDRAIADVPEDVRHLVSVLATGFVLFTLLVQATTLRPLIRWPGRRSARSGRAHPARPRPGIDARARSWTGCRETAIIHGLDIDAAEEVGALYRKRASTLEASADPADEMLQAAASGGPGHHHLARGVLLHGRDGRGHDLARRPAGCCFAGPTSCWTPSGMAASSPTARRRGTRSAAT